MKKNKLVGNVSVFGCGKYDTAVIYNLAAKHIGLHYHSYITNDVEFDDEYGTQFVDTVSSRILLDQGEADRVKKLVDCMVVILPGDQLVENIDLLLSLNIPLIICQIDYCSETVCKKVKVNNTDKVLIEGINQGADTINESLLKSIEKFI